MLHFCQSYYHCLTYHHYILPKNKNNVLKWHFKLIMVVLLMISDTSTELQNILSPFLLRRVKSEVSDIHLKVKILHFRYLWMNNLWHFLSFNQRKQKLLMPNNFMKLCLLFNFLLDLISLNILWCEFSSSKLRWNSITNGYMSVKTRKIIT